MANNRYIGARYVPLIVGDWNSANAYEALSVVMYQGDSYISKVPVPANIQITNTTYWAKCADYNAQWAAFQQNWTEFQANLPGSLITNHNYIYGTVETSITINAGNIAGSVVITPPTVREALSNYDSSMSHRLISVNGYADNSVINPNGHIISIEAPAQVTSTGATIRAIRSDITDTANAITVPCKINFFVYQY